MQPVVNAGITLAELHHKAFDLIRAVKDEIGDRLGKQKAGSIHNFHQQILGKIKRALPDESGVI